jgi:hypothetical protein
MALKIVSPTENLGVKNVILTIYGQPGIGKTSLAFTASRPILFDFDEGAYRSPNRKDVVVVDSWDDVVDIRAKDLEGYDTVVIDTVGRAVDLLSVSLISDPKYKARGAGGGLSLQGFGILKYKFGHFINSLRTMGKDIVFVSHMTEQVSGESILERIDIQGASKNEIYKLSTAMCRIRISEDDTRYLDFDPRHGGYGKNPCGFDKIPFVEPSKDPELLARIIAEIKEKLNKNAQEATKALNEESLWQKAFSENPSLEDFNNNIVPLARERKGRFGIAVRNEAKRRGYVYQKETGLFALEETGVLG